MYNDPQELYNYTFNFPVPTLEANTLTWTNAPGAENFRIYAFASATETDAANAVGVAIRPGDPVVAWANRQEIEFDLTTAEFEPALTNGGEYYLRVQAISQNVPVRGQEGLTWGEDSLLSEATASAWVATTEAGEVAGTDLFRVAPVMVDGNVFVPLRAVSDALGGEIAWEAATATVTLVFGDEEIIFAIGETAPGMDAPAQIVNNLTVVPLGFISEFFGVETTQNAAGQIEIEL